MATSGRQRAGRLRPRRARHAGRRACSSRSGAAALGAARRRSCAVAGELRSSRLRTSTRSPAAGLIVGASLALARRAAGRGGAARQSGADARDRRSGSREERAVRRDQRWLVARRRRSPCLAGAVARRATAGPRAAVPEHADPGLRGAGELAARWPSGRGGRAHRGRQPGERAGRAPRTAAYAEAVARARDGGDAGARLRGHGLRRARPPRRGAPTSTATRAGTASTGSSSTRPRTTRATCRPTTGRSRRGARRGRADDRRINPGVVPGARVLRPRRRRRDLRGPGGGVRGRAGARRRRGCRAARERIAHLVYGASRRGGAGRGRADAGRAAST